LLRAITPVDAAIDDLAAAITRCYAIDIIAADIDAADIRCRLLITILR